ncbi:glycosyltransferase [Nocardioides sp.]|jgi:glycosyltransferase involved in cell wall biosynthesis|uniref:glycosyltransferase n=1 Tax=Nocardioides sp. TaxID=35761 RepID=UPI002F3E68CA
MRSWSPAFTGRPSVSVAMATYNGERYLPEMLESLAAQTRLPDELVVRDDGSEDGTVGILHAFARRVPFRVEVIAGGPHLDYAQNFVAASSACSGNVIFFADQDDAWRPPKLATVAQHVRRSAPRAFFHDFALVTADGTQVAPSYYDLLAERGFPPVAALKGCSMAVTRAFVDTWGWPPPDAPVSHDFWVALLATAFGQRRNLAEPLIDHRIHGANASGWIPEVASRQFTEPGDGAGPVRLLIDLVLKPPRLNARTRVFLDVLDARGDAVDPGIAHRLRRLLRANRNRHDESSS